MGLEWAGVILGALGMLGSVVAFYLLWPLRLAEARQANADAAQKYAEASVQVLARLDAETARSDRLEAEVARLAQAYREAEAAHIKERQQWETERRHFLARLAELEAAHVKERQQLEAERRALLATIAELQSEVARLSDQAANGHTPPATVTP